MFELILGQCQWDPDPVKKILIGRIRPKMDRICNPAWIRIVFTFRIWTLVQYLHTDSGSAAPVA